MIRPVIISDAENICNIYNYYILNSTITFEEKSLSADEMISRIKNIIKNYPWLVYEEEGKVTGYTYAGEWKKRSAYRYSAETGIYIDPKHVGKGIGTKLKGELIKGLKEKSIHSIICGIALPNPASIALCEKFGFEKVAHLKEVGYKFNKWIDVGYWELIL
jgi:L-amino acid N-acyltransferase YncA